MSDNKIAMQKLAAKIEDACSRHDNCLTTLIAKFKELDPDGIVNKAEHVWDDQMCEETTVNNFIIQ